MSAKVYATQQDKHLTSKRNVSKYRSNRGCCKTKALGPILDGHAVEIKELYSK